MGASTRRALLFVALVISCACQSDPPASWLGAPERIAGGVELYRVSDATLLDPPAPIAIYLLRLDPGRVKIGSALSNARVVDAERVDAIAARAQAIAAVNAGFFNVRNGEPAGVLKVAGELVSDSALRRGVVAIGQTASGAQTLAFDQVSVRMHLTMSIEGREMSRVIDGVDTTRARGKLMVYTPSYHSDTDTAPRGIEWVIAGTPLQVVEIRRDAGKTPIPPDGVVLSYGGLEPPEPLAWLEPGTPVRLRAHWQSETGLPHDTFDTAVDIINGAGLLIRNGKTLDNWHTTENLKASTFTAVRHPRTLIGVDGAGSIWLVVIDGRQPDHSMGMTFAELVRLCARLDLQNALNLDGGGSTTMVVGGEIVNRPSDATGPRPVSDAIVVTQR
jgi:hypothetical protein